LGPPSERQLDEQHNPSFLNQKGHPFVWTHLEGRAPAQKFQEDARGTCPGKASWFNACMAHFVGPCDGFGWGFVMNYRVAVQREAVEWWHGNTWRPPSGNQISSFLPWIDFHAQYRSKKRVGATCSSLLISSNVPKVPHFVSTPAWHPLGLRCVGLMWLIGHLYLSAIRQSRYFVENWHQKDTCHNGIGILCWNN
jgi:hypothetical protein